MILKGSNGSFGRISAVGVRWGQLKIYILFFHELLQLSTHFIIQSLQFWAKSSLGEVFENSLVRSAHFRSRSAFHWFGQDAVGVIVIDDHYVLVARNRRYQETADLRRSGPLCHDNQQRHSWCAVGVVPGGDPARFRPPQGEILA